MPLSSLAPSTDDVSLVIDSVQVYINADLLGNASLHVTRSRLSWVLESGQSFSLEYPSINMHSISRDKTIFPHECLFLMVEGDAVSKAEMIMKGEATTMTTTTTSKPADDDVTSEIRFVLKDSSQLQTLFDNMSDCQALNEDQARDGMEEEAEYEEEEDYGEEKEEEEYEDEAVGIIDGEAVVDYSALCPADDDMTPQGLATLKRLEAALCNGVENSENGTAQFDDAEAEPEPMTA